MLTTAAAAESASFLMRHLQQHGHEGVCDDGNQSCAKALALLESMSDSKLCELFEGYSLSSDIVPLIGAVLYGCDLCTQSEQVFNRRKKCFQTAINVLKGGCLSQQACRDLIELLGPHARQLYNEQILSLIDAMLDGGPLGGASSLTQLLDLLPLLVGDSVDCREHAVERLYDMLWPCELVLGYTSALVSLCTSETECERAMTKIMSYLVHNANGNANMQHVSNAMCNVDPEELPILVYHLTSISKKCTSSTSIKGSLLEVLAESLDAILTTSQEHSRQSTHEIEAERIAYVRRMCPVLATITHHITTMLTKDQGIANELVALVKTRRMTTAHSVRFHQTGGPLLSSSKLLLALLSSKTPRNEIKTLSALVEFVQDTFALEPVDEVSLWFQPSIWSKVINVNADHLCHVFNMLLLNCSALHLEAVSVPLVNLAFLLIASPAVATPTDIGTLSFTTGPVGNNGVIKSTARGMLLQSNLQYVPPHSARIDSVSPTQAPKSPGAFGAWLLCNIFIYNDHTRIQIARELVVRLLVHAQITAMPAGNTKQISVGGKHKESIQNRSSAAGSSVMPPPASANSLPAAGHLESDQEVALLCISILENLAITCRKGMLEVAVDLQEAFVALPELAGPTASRLVVVLGGFFGTSPGLSDRCTLALRKSGFARDIIHRKAAVYSLIALLRLHLHSAALDATSSTSSAFFPSNGASSSNRPQFSIDGEAGAYLEINELNDNHYGMSSQQTTEQLMSHSVASSGVGAFIGISVDEIMSMCRRLLNCQREIRVTLYNLLVQLQLDYPSCRGTSLRLLNNHLSTLIAEEKFDLSWSVMTSTRAKSTHPSQRRRVSDAEYIVLHPEKYIDIVSGMPQESLSDILQAMLMLACPFLLHPNDILLTSGRQFMNGRQTVSISQWDNVNISFVRDRLGPSGASELKFRSPSEIFLLYTHSSYCSRRFCDDVESADARDIILKICKGLTDTPLSDLRIPPRIPDTGASVADQHRIFTVLESLHVAMTCAIILPDTTFVDCDGIDMTDERSVQYISAAASRPRLKLLNYLCTQADILSALAIAVRKNTKNTGLFPSIGCLPHMSSPLLRLIQSTNVSVVGSICTAFTNKVYLVGCPTDMHSGLHIIISEFQFLLSILVMLNKEEDEDEATFERPGVKTETCDGNIGLDDGRVSFARISDVLTPENILFLEIHVLERTVVAFECALTLLNAITKCERINDTASPPASSMSNTCTESVDRSGVLWAWWGWFAVRTMNVKLFSLLLSFFRRQRTKDRGAGAEKRSSGSDCHCVFSNKQFSNLQLVLRSMLGSLRLEVSISHIIATHYAARDNIAGIPCCHDDVPVHAGLVILLEKAFEGVMRSRGDIGTCYGSLLTQRLGLDGGGNTQNIATTAYTQDGESGSTQWVQILQTHIKNFGKLFLAMHGMEGEKSESSAIVCILAELFDVLGSVPTAQRDSADHFLRYCRDKLVNSSGSLSRGLIQLTILHAAPDPADRLRRALQCGLMIQAVALAAGADDSAEPDSDADDDPLFSALAPQSAGNSVFVSTSSIHQAASIIILMMEKACNEIELLYKLAKKESVRFDKKSAAVFSWMQPEGARLSSTTNNPHELNNIICATLLRVIRVLEKILHRELTSISVKLLSTIVKIYKFLIKLSKEIIVRVNKGIEAASTCVSPMYRTLCFRVVDKLAVKLSGYLMHVRNVDYSTAHDESSDEGEDGPRQRKRNTSTKASVNQRLKKLVPDVIYQMEQLDVMFIRLSSALRGAEKVIVSKWIRRTAVCDFKLKTDMIQKEQRRAEILENKNNRKRKKTQYTEMLDHDENRRVYPRLVDDRLCADEETAVLSYYGDDGVLDNL